MPSPQCIHGCDARERCPSLLFISPGQDYVDSSQLSIYEVLVGGCCKPQHEHPGVQSLAVHQPCHSGLSALGAHHRDHLLHQLPVLFLSFSLRDSDAPCLCLPKSGHKEAAKQEEVKQRNPHHGKPTLMSTRSRRYPFCCCLWALHCVSGRAGARKAGRNRALQEGHGW